jgi:hypothetical protein
MRVSAGSSVIARRTGTAGASGAGGAAVQELVNARTE